MCYGEFILKTVDVIIFIDTTFFFNEKCKAINILTFSSRKDTVINDVVYFVIT